MENSEILKLPNIMPSQAQKHVTHNEAIRQLDALIQLSVVSMQISDPPSEPAAGSRYIIGEGASGDWAGLEGQVAAYLDGFWTVFEPLDGWLAFVQYQNAVVVRTSETWQDLSSPQNLQNLDLVGVGAQADAVNKLSVASDASLFSYAGNSHRMKINKAEETESASMIFQSNWLGHAEFGLTGSNDFQVKVSDDGNNFLTALQIDKSTGLVQFPLGAEAISRIDFSGRWSAYPDNRWTTFSSAHGASDGEFNNGAGTTSEPLYNISQYGPLVRRGSRISSFFAALKSSSFELNTVKIRLVFQYSEPAEGRGGPQINPEVLYEHDSFFVSSYEFTKIEAQVSDYFCPDDGFLLMFVKPVGTRSNMNYVYSSASIEIVST